MLNKPKINKEPEAVKILQKIKKEFDSFKTLELSFEIEMDFPGGEKDKQKGMLHQEGNKYRVQTDEFVIICDAKSIWFINKKNKEGQINKVGGKDDGFSLFSPMELLKIYERDDHHIGLVNEYTDKGQAFQQIEFVPIDRGTDYSKARLTVKKQSNQISEILFFNRDGSKMKLRVLQVQKNKPSVPNLFTYDAKQFPGVFLEDLR